VTRWLGRRARLSSALVRLAAVIDRNTTLTNELAAQMRGLTETSRSNP
jgi:hypothetical protein